MIPCVKASNLTKKFLGLKERYPEFYNSDLEIIGKPEQQDILLNFLKPQPKKMDLKQFVTHKFK